MRYSEITEGRTHLKLNKGVANLAASNYAALLAVMDPMDFIRLTCKTEKEVETVLSNAKVGLDDFNASIDPDFSYTQYNAPFLDISWPDGRVRKHEGRHRAARVAKAGGKKFPVAIFFVDRGYIYRAHPDRGQGDDGWNPDPWHVEDMPAQLIGQYDQSVVVPTSRMRIGVMKRRWLRKQDPAG